MTENKNNLRTYFLVFGYGSLMWCNWESDFQGSCKGKAILRGYHRAFNKKSTSNWGTPKNPCPTLGLEASDGAECIGLVFKFQVNNRDLVEAYLKKREGPSFQLVELEVELEGGQLERALTAINDPERFTYIGNVNFNTLVDMARDARGEKGTCIDYIHNIYLKCEELGIEDEYVQNLWEATNQNIS